MVLLSIRSIGPPIRQSARQPSTNLGIIALDELKNHNQNTVKKPPTHPHHLQNPTKDRQSAPYRSFKPALKSHMILPPTTIAPLITLRFRPPRSEYPVSHGILPGVDVPFLSKNRPVQGSHQLSQETLCCFLRSWWCSRTHFSVGAPIQDTVGRDIDPDGLQHGGPLTYLSASALLSLV